MKKLVLTMVAALACLVSTAQVSWNDYKVYYVTNPAAHSVGTDHELKNQSGWSIVKPSRLTKTDSQSKGLLIYHCMFNDEYFAFDRECQECKANGEVGLIYMKTNITCRCNRCGSEFQNVSQGSPQQTNHSGDYWLIQYNCLMKNGKLIISTEDLYSQIY